VLTSHGRRRRAEIAPGFCSQQQVHHSVGDSARLITSACRYADNSASTSDVADADEVGAVWRPARPTGQRASSSVAAVVVCWRADLTARIAPRQLPTAKSPLASRVRTDALCSADLAAWPACTVHAVQTRPE